MRQAIYTKFHGPGNVRGSRVSARADAGRISLEWDHRLGIDENHERAARALMAKFKWDEYADIIGGGMPQAMGGMVFVQVKK